MAALSPEEAADFLWSASERVHEELVGLVSTVTQGAHLLALSYVGNQQESWLPLSDATIFGFRHAAGFWVKGKADLGFAGPDYEPLRRTGEMAASYATDLIEEPGLITGALGSPDKIALFQEMGTPSARYPIPPRPVTAEAVMNMIPVALDLMEETMVSLLTPE